MKTERLVVALVAGLIAAQVVLVVVSWLLSATTSGSVHTLLSAEGLRWFFGSFARLLASPLLACLLLLSMAWGCISGSRLLRPSDSLPVARRRLALRLAFGVALLCVLAVVLLACVPHAVLLSPTGHLWPSPFSRAVVPLVAMALILVAAVYGLASRAFQSFGDIVQALISGVSTCAPLLVLYVFMVQFYESLRYVFQ